MLSSLWRRRRGRSGRLGVLVRTCESLAYLLAGGHRAATAAVIPSSTAHGCSRFIHHAHQFFDRILDLWLWAPSNDRRRPLAPRPSIRSLSSLDAGNGQCMCDRHEIVRQDLHRLCDRPTHGLVDDDSIQASSVLVHSGIQPVAEILQSYKAPLLRAMRVPRSRNRHYRRIQAPRLLRLRRRPADQSHSIHRAHDCLHCFPPPDAQLLPAIRTSIRGACRADQPWHRNVQACSLVLPSLTEASGIVRTSPAPGQPISRRLRGSLTAMPHAFVRRATEVRSRWTQREVVISSVGRCEPRSLRILLRCLRGRYQIRLGGRHLISPRRPVQYG